MFQSYHRFIKRFIGIGLGVLVLSACQPSLSTTNSIESPTTMNPPLTITLGQRGIDMVRQANNGKEDRQPVGALFHDVRWHKAPFGTVQFQHGPQSFTMNTVFWVMSTSWERIDTGVNAFDIVMGVSPEEFISHQEAYKRIFGMLDELLAKGWQRYVEPAAVPVKGKDAWRLVMEERDFLRDPTYRPTFEEWMKANASFPMNVPLYANGVLINIKVERDNERMDVNKPGQYILMLDIRTVRGEIGGYIKVGDLTEEQRKNWIPIWNKRLAELKEIRKREILRLQKLGYKIDTTYRDPDWSQWVR